MDLRPAVQDAIRTVRGGNPFLPVQVVVPNHLLGVWLSRSIFKDTGHMAIEFDAEDDDADTEGDEDDE